MFNPPGSYEDVLRRVTQRVQHSHVDDQILGLLQQAFEQELGQENTVLSRPARKRLFQQVARTILSDALGRIGDPE